MAFSGNGGVRAMKPGDYQATIFPGTQAGIQAALDYCNTPGGEVRLGPGTFSDITNLTVYGKTTISGSGAQNTLLVRSASATGTTLREKTTAEGNAAQGAAGIIVRDCSIWANGSSGDGINFGNQGNAAFTSNASLKDIFVRDFTGGTAVTLNANSIQCSNVWTHVNQVGFYISGGASHYNGLWAEANTVTGIRVASPYNTFTHVHLEDNAVGATSLLEVGIAGGPAGQAKNNIFMGVTAQLGANMTNLLIEKSGVGGTQWLGVRVIAGGFTYSNLIYDETASTGTGSTTYYVPFMFEMGDDGGAVGWIRDAALGWRLPLGNNNGFQQQGNNSMASASTVFPGVGSWFTMSGSVTVDNIGSPTNGRTIWIQTAAAPTFKHLSGGTGNIRLVASADVVMSANDVIQFTSDGTNWYQSAPVVAV